MPLPRRLFGRAVAVVSIAALLASGAVGCFGRFELTRKVYRFNQQVDPDKWIQWIAFLVMNVIPIYSLAVWIDVLFGNSVEFWTGKNPISSTEVGTPRVAFGPNGERAVAVMRADGAMDLTLEEPTGAVHRVVLVRTPEGVDARDPDGRTLARLLHGDGGPRIVAAH